jgi:cyclopropane fatty-acyl-phospholipid synthase-like methyltransferase
VNEVHPHGDPNTYWEKAGEVGYDEAMHVSQAVAQHILEKSWKTAITIADRLGVPSSARVLDLGCGDGDFANKVLARRYHFVDGLDKAEAAITRAEASASTENVHFEAVDITNLDYGRLPLYECAFLIGILHHVKEATPKIMAGLSLIARHVVVLEPNGNHILRKILEQTPAYRSAGEDSFRLTHIKTIFNAADYDIPIFKRINLFPNMTPEFLFHLFLPLETRLEQSRSLDFLLTVNMFGLSRKGEKR